MEKKTGRIVKIRGKEHSVEVCRSGTAYQLYIVQYSSCVMTDNQSKCYRPFQKVFLSQLLSSRDRNNPLLHYQRSPRLFLLSTMALVFYCRSLAKQDTSPPSISPSALPISPDPTMAPHLFRLGLLPHPYAPDNSYCHVKTSLDDLDSPVLIFQISPLLKCCYLFIYFCLTVRFTLI